MSRKKGQDFGQATALQMSARGPHSPPSSWMASGSLLATARLKSQTYECFHTSKQVRQSALENSGCWGARITASYRFCRSPGGQGD